MSGYEELRQRHVERLLGLLPSHLERLTWPRAALDAWRTDRLRQLVSAALERSRWHRDRLDGIEIGALDATDLSVLPVMTKQDVMSAFDDIVTDNRLTLGVVNEHLASLVGDAYLFDEYHVVASGGSSGVRGVFGWGWDAWAEAFLGTMRSTAAEVMRNPDPEGISGAVMIVAAQRASHSTSALSQTFTMPNMEICRIPVDLALDEIIATLNDVNGSSLVAYSSMLGLLVAEARAGRLTIAPRRVVATAEPLLPEVRAAVAELWGATVANLWGTSECGVTAFGCYQADGLHLCDDLVIVEPVDARGDPVEPGVRSDKVYVTNLINPLFPLIRYEISDQITMLDEPCVCGSAHRRIADIEGRTDDLFEYDGRITVHPHVFRSALGGDPGIVEYQVRQTERGAAISVLGVPARPIDDTARQIERDLRRVGVANPSVEIRVADSLDRHGETGKLVRFIPAARTAPVDHP